MLVNKEWVSDIAEDIIYEFENVLCEHKIKINNAKPEENQFATEDACINLKEYNELKEKIIKQLHDFADSVEDDVRAAA